MMFSATRRLERAYTGTDYLVGRMTLRIGRPLPDRLLGKANCAIIITAANPESRRAPRAMNARRDARLQVILRSEAAGIMPTLARDPARRWPDEPGWLAKGLSLMHAAAIARRFRQNAIVVLRRRQPPCLHALR
jgi:hypothetical protein